MNKKILTMIALLSFFLIFFSTISTVLAGNSDDEINEGDSPPEEKSGQEEPTEGDSPPEEKGSDPTPDEGDSPPEEK